MVKIKSLLPKDTPSVSLITFASVGIFCFLIIASTFTFKDKIFLSLFPKQSSYASEISSLPSVDLKINFQENNFDGVLNIKTPTPGIKLIWVTSGEPTFCTGLSWIKESADESWNGGKDPKGGEFIINNLVPNSPHLYTINCINAYGDSSGDSVTINVNPQNINLSPNIVSLFVEGISNKGTDKDPIIVTRGTPFVVNWQSLNTNTPYSRCITTGSWPIIYGSSIKDVKKENLIIQDNLLHKFSLYCSNESSATKASLTIVAE